LPFYGEALHEARRNQDLHYDFWLMEIIHKNPPYHFEHVLVLLDDLSGLAKSFHVRKTASAHVVDALVDCIRAFELLKRMIVEAP
jgi:hypothetical protein